ncbi:hypothetical protein [Sphingomonas sp. CFBP 8760]|uniref:hypothetical protein n=1 Tax=Sphingomonas sp. CFBP 8760 TaxID=2775282 RepID=UPI001783A59F|nr:hypothetical protein [Sphingomonas sp. CFBP 8760]MBD8548844.1 hypothetical protein [Sphingomonas sp. CFBP 8760]
MAKTLSRFTIEPKGEDYLLLIEDEDGETMEISATLEQLDLLGETIDELLEKDDADEE